MPPASEITDRAELAEILGYLNFSSGATDPKFLRNLNTFWAALVELGHNDDVCQTAYELLAAKLEALAGTTPAFQDISQAKVVLRLIFEEVLPGYRRHHRDLLFHQSDAALWQPLFIGRVAEAVLAEGEPWNETERIVAGALARLNDYVGYRPVAVLEKGKHEPYSHERSRPIPLYVAGAGVAPGKYHDIVEQALKILRETDADILSAAGFDPDALQELAFDPRAYDFNHPVNRRPNYHFGQWDPDHIDNRGRYRRFVVQQATLDAALARVEKSPGQPREELIFEAGAVLAGTVLMASGTTGGSPDAHDSTVSLATLLPHIARYRDEFYARLFAKLPVHEQQRLQANENERRQPFAGARQHLNAELARLRALQLQHVRLAILFARLGASEAAMREAEIVPAASARLVCQMQCLLALGRRMVDGGRLSDALERLAEIEDLLTRAIRCGAVVDPWNILGFGGQFSLFPAVENSIPDERVDELVDLVDQVFSLYARLWHEAATADHPAVVRRLSTAFAKLTKWWDEFASTTVSGVRGISGADSYAAAEKVATALAAWQKAGEAANDLAFWRRHADQFESPQAYARVVEVLLDKNDRTAAVALLMHWLSEAETVGLDDSRYQFQSLTARWLNAALGRTYSGHAGAARQAEEPLDQRQIFKFFDFLEANAGEYWEVPGGDVNSTAAGHSEHRHPQDAEGDGIEDDQDTFSAAYENMVYRDSTADGIDADMLEGAGPTFGTDSELAREHQKFFSRLGFLSMLAGLWKTVALALSKAPTSAADLPPEWLKRCGENLTNLLALARTIERRPVMAPSAAYDVLLEYDRQRVMRETLLERIIITAAVTADAELILAAATQNKDELAIESDDSLADARNVAFWRSLLAADAEAVRDGWGSFLAHVVGRPLLYVPLSRGGSAENIFAARATQQMLRELLSRLPRLGLVRETCQLLRAARVMEKSNPQGVGAVTEFDRLFEIGYKAIVECLLEASSGPTTGEMGERGDIQLIENLQQLTESVLPEWLAHSSTLRISVMEKIASPKAWEELVQFIERYGRELFTQQFLNLGNLRAIFHQGVDAWLDRMMEDESAAEEIPLIADLEKKISKNEAKRHLSLVIEAVIENYGEYRDYNATTTQSDRGEMLHMFLDFLRLKVGYERIHWNLRPVMMAHDVLVRRSYQGAAELWRRAIAARTAEAADEQLSRLAALQAKYGIRLSTIADRFSERFVRPLVIDRMRALVGPAASEARKGSATSALSVLEQEATELADEPCGAGLDVPDWLESLEEEIRATTRGSGRETLAVESQANLPWQRLTWEEIQSQLADWDQPPEISK
jgi:hypothetical protein